MFKVSIMMILLFSASAFANSNLNKEYFIGKWQCQIKDNNPSIKQIHELHFLKNGKVSEYIRIDYGQKTAYDYQIETAVTNSNWKFGNDSLIYSNYKIHTYKVRMPNSKKDDIHQATIAVEKSLPIIQSMLNNSVTERQFDINIIDKKSFLMNDSYNLILMTCNKKGLLSNLF